jgi:hypothetical protein
MKHPRHDAADRNLQAATPPPPISADREARERLAVVALAREIRACRGVIPESDVPSLGIALG